MKPNAGRFLTEQFSASTPRKSSISWMHESYYLNAAHATGSTNLLTSAGCSVCCVPTWHFSDKASFNCSQHLVTDSDRLPETTGSCHHTPTACSRGGDSVMED
ncbi:cardiac phospholamban isoform X6 [Tympanuchus pallidicinctus]|uniref:cardiac phospholamban isoform X6 n=1 Tax=Tympanuchus pallidicinctus TaxID=109042 RepID=UPI00228701B1|nr:cardiac phospholamban isoform X6 [Tympanuchus pallidicinctus]